MKKARRPLVVGLKPAPKVDPEIEKAFIRDSKPELAKSAPIETSAPMPETRETKGRSEGPIGRLPLSMRIRADYGRALKRASLQRHLDGTEPHQLQDIVEEALEAWLRSHGYLS